MKFRTEITIEPLDNRLKYGDSLLSIGSCFAENMAQRLRQAKFNAVSSPTGILFNPLSIASTINRFAEAAAPSAEELVFNNGLWHSFDAHSSLSSPSKEATLEALTKAITEGHNALKQASHVIITLGTAWVYTLENGTVVANCHKFPHSHFTRRRLSVEEVVQALELLCSKTLSGKHIIFTISPVRHIADGLAENTLSKATLRVAVDIVCSRCSNAHYFPAYECLNDDLRDYRFYADDMVHPSQQAVEYIWEKFTEVAIEEKSRALMPQVAKVVAAASHRPFNPESREYAAFCRNNLRLIEELPNIDFSEERAIFERYSDNF